MPPYQDTELDACKAQLSLFASRLDDLKACMGQESVKMGGVKLESLLHTTSWVKRELLCSSYHVFHDPITPLDTVGASQMSNKEFLDERRGPPVAHQTQMGLALRYRRIFS